LSWNLEEVVEHLTMAILLNPKSAILCYLCYAGCINIVGCTALATVSLAPQVAGNSMDYLRILLRLVVSHIE
jgi:hypothetical protein